jgi:hypothetical protein
MMVKLQSYSVNGAPRWYLIRKVYVSGTHRVVKIAYLGYPPNAKMRKLVAGLNKTLEGSKAFDGGKILPQILALKLALRAKALAKRKLQRHRAAQRKPKVAVNPWNTMVARVHSVKLAFDKLKEESPLSEWPQSNREEALKLLAPFRELAARLIRGLEK